MKRFLLSVACTASLFLLFLRWATERAEGQIDKMQEAAFSSPGSEAPVPPDVIVGGIGVVTTCVALGKLLGLRGWQSALSLMGGGVTGGILFLQQRKG